MENHGDEFHSRKEKLLKKDNLDLHKGKVIQRVHQACHRDPEPCHLHWSWQSKCSTPCSVGHRLVKNTWSGLPSGGMGHGPQQLMDSYLGIWGASSDVSSQKRLKQSLSISRQVYSVDSKQEITGWQIQTDVFQCVFRIFHLFNIRILKTDVSRELSHNIGVCNKVLSLRLGPQCHKSLNFFPSLQLPPYIIYSLNVSLKLWSDPQFPLWTISPVHPQTPSHIGLKLHKAFLWV